MTTLRQEVEAELGVAKIGKRSPAWYIHQAPSAWRKTMRYWAALMLGVVLGAVGAGVLAVTTGVVR
jgi:hypothetical protein